MQNAGIAALGLDWRYLAFDVHPDNLRNALAGTRAMNYIGVNLTVPHKLLALDMMAAVRQTGARGATIGRNAWSSPNITAAVLAFKSVIHDGASPGEAMAAAGL